ncbi:hypothetical protein DSO57_1037046 [Entomophthora muscae]|uniref:Uncharacterized protein n=1 Tax=Entomophthora muscae TaxID=34485 RepID=A0ACC2U8H8_9FUNG|nr:hypothetical protein DSO57_1037046 [Entomophthora muscae]
MERNIPSAERKCILSLESGIIDEAGKIKYGVRQGYASFINKPDHLLAKIYDKLQTESESSILTLEASRTINLSKVWDVCQKASLGRLASGERVADESLGSNASEILVKVELRKVLIDELREFEARTKSHWRLKGPSFQLMKEDKFRKAGYLQLKKVEDKLLEMLVKFEKTHHQPFIYEGHKLRTILTKAIERRYGNVEIIGLHDSLSTQSFSRPHVKSNHLP